MIKRIIITLARDSVCMGDDVDDHTKIIDIIPMSNLYMTVMNIAKSYLPYIAGYGHTWDCYLNGVKIAIINGNCNKIIPTSDNSSFTNRCQLFFKYHSTLY